MWSRTLPNRPLTLALASCLDNRNSLALMYITRYGSEVQRDDLFFAFWIRVMLRFPFQMRGTYELTFGHALINGPDTWEACIHCMHRLVHPSAKKMP